MKKLICIIAVLIMTAAIGGCDSGSFIEKEDEKTEIITKIPSDDVTDIINVSVYDIDTFNPLATNSQSVKDAMKFVYEPLFSLDEKMTVIPVLADSYSVSADGQSMDVRLREDVSWHDGSAFAAADVNYTIKAMLSGTAKYDRSLESISGCSIIDNYVIRIYMNRPAPDSAAILTFPIVKNNTSMQINPDYKPIGTGPFAYKGMVSVDRYMLVPADDYYRGKPKLGGVYVDIVPDQHRYHTMFDSGNIDVCNVKLLEGFEYTAKANMNTNECVSNELIYIGVNHNSTNLSDRNIRRGISAFIDRRAIEEYAMYSGVKATNSVITPMSEYYFADDTALNMDSVKGTACIEAAGWKAQAMGYEKTNGAVSSKLSVVLLVNSDNSDDMKIAHKVKDNLMANGINVNLQSLQEMYYNQRIAAGNYDLFIGRRKMPLSGDVSEFIGAGNMFGYNNPTIDIVTREIATETDKEKSFELYKQLFDVLDEDMPVVPLAYSKEMTYMSARIENISPMSVDGFYRDLQNWSIK